MALDRSSHICCILQHLRQMQNLNTLMAVVGGLTHSALARLSKTNACIPQDVQMVRAHFPVTVLKAHLIVTQGSANLRFISPTARRRGPSGSRGCLFCPKTHEREKIQNIRQSLPLNHQCWFELPSRSMELVALFLF